MSGVINVRRSSPDPSVADFCNELVALYDANQKTAKRARDKMAADLESAQAKVARYMEVGRTLQRLEASPQRRPS